MSLHRLRLDDAGLASPPICMPALAAGALAAALAGPGAAQPADPPLPTISALKSEYLRCEHISSKRRLSAHGLAYCSSVSQQLLKREFGGDSDLLLAWSREARRTDTASNDR